MGTDPYAGFRSLDIQPSSVPPFASQTAQETSFDTGGDLQDSQAVWQNADEEEEEDHITSESDGTDWEDDSGNEESNFDSDFEDYFDGSRDAPVDLAHPARAMPPRLLDMEDVRLRCIHGGIHKVISRMCNADAFFHLQCPCAGD